MTQHMMPACGVRCLGSSFRPLRCSHHLQQPSLVRCLRPDSSGASSSRRSRHRLHAVPSSSEGAPAQSQSVDITARVAEQFYAMQSPASFNRPYSKAVTDFTDSAILAYECGYNEESLRAELRQLLAARAADIERGCGPQSGPLRFMQVDEDACMLGCGLVWITVMTSPRGTVNRWATAAPVTDATLRLWQGFVTMIVEGYFNKRMAWYPIDRLQLELSAVQGAQHKQEIVAEYARIVYTALEKLYPQFPTM